jgi:hypothetical protein
MQPDHMLAFQPGAFNFGNDLLKRHPGTVEKPGTGGRPGENGFRYQGPGIDDKIGFRQGVAAFDRYQLRISRTGTHEKDWGMFLRHFDLSGHRLQPAAIFDFLK